MSSNKNCEMRQAQFKNNFWSEIGTLHTTRRGHAAVGNAMELFIIGGAGSP